MCKSLRAAFPGRVVVSAEVAVVELTAEISASVSRDGDVTLWDTRGTDYTCFVAALSSSVTPSRSAADRVVQTLLAAQAALEATSGFLPSAAGDALDDIAALPRYDPTSDRLLHTLRDSGRVDTRRPLRIVTYGTRFVFHPPAGTQRVFDASVLHGERNRFTARLRGTDPELQHTVRVIPEFEGFVRDIVRAVECEALTHIAVICRAGHHRSVTVAEWLALLYPDAIVSHLTIK